MAKGKFITLSVSREMNDEMEALAKLSGQPKSFHIKEMWEFYRDTFGIEYKRAAHTLQAAKKKITRKSLSIR